MINPGIEIRNLEEKVIWVSITWTWIFYVMGALYILAPAIAWLLLLWIFFKPYFDTPPGQPIKHPSTPLGVWIWIVGMIVMEIALIAGHLNFDLGLGKTIKSSIGWAKGWALMAIFIWIGANLQIRAELLYRASCVLALYTLMLIPIMMIAPYTGIPGTLYISPLKAVGGPGPEFFEVQLYGISYDGTKRWRFWSPWGPAAGFVANIYFIFALREKNLNWKLIGAVCAILICFMSGSRLALVSIILVTTMTFFLSQATRPKLLLFLGAPALLVMGIMLPEIMTKAEDAKAKFDAARPDSSRVRADLGHIAVQRWQNEAPIFGHGIVEEGPHLVEHMPIGSHHNWYGLLFVKGLVGFFACLIPMLWSTIEMLVKAQARQAARGGLAVMLTLLLYTFGENMEILVYLYWPGLILVGIATAQVLRNPFGLSSKEIT